MKTCNGCGALKPLDAFYRKANAQDGRASRCKDCENRVKRERRPPRNRPKERLAKARYKERNAEKLKAHYAIRDALRRGKLTKPSECESCGEPGRLHAHHHDYARPLDVRWLCPACHKAAHAEEAKVAA